MAWEAQADWHGSVSLLSDYQYRGYTKSRSNPVVQGHLDYEDDSGWFAGATVSQVSFDDKQSPDRASFEARPYLGWSFPLFSKLRADLTAWGYLFDGHVFGRPAHYAEISASMTYDNWLTGRISVAPDAYQRGVDILDYEAQARHDLTDSLQLSVGLGYQQAGRLLDYDYFYWNAGATWFVMPHLAVDMRYSDAQVNAEEEVYPYWEFYPRPIENKWVLSITWGF